jgi:Uma2 family endonuclease
MARMAEMQELLEEPLSCEELGARYRALCEDPCYANIPGKIELDVWGRMLMSPASSYHIALQVELATRLKALGGRAFVEAGIVTDAGILVPDVAWASDDFMRLHGFETPYKRAHDICVEVVSPSNSRKEMREKMTAYIAAGATEVWLMYPTSKRYEFFNSSGLSTASRYPVDLVGIFDL